MKPKTLENSIYTTIPPTIETPYTEEELHEMLDTTLIEIEESEHEANLEEICKEEEYFENLIDLEPSKEAEK